MISTDADLFNRLVNRSKAAGNLCAIRIGKLVRKSDKVLLFGDHVVGHAPVALPSISAPVFLAGARNHVAATAIVAYAAAGDVIHDHAIANRETPASWPDFYN